MYVVETEPELQPTCIDVLNGADSAPDLSDAELVQRTLDGDKIAFDCLVFKYRRLVFSVAHSLVGNWDQAEDVAQQAFLNALLALPRLRELKKFKTWLVTITKRCAVRHRIRSMPKDVEFNDEMFYFSGFTYEESADTGLKDRIRTSLSELSQRSRAVIVMHYLDGYSCKEIGSRLDIPPGTVKRILHESRNELRKRMEVAVPMRTMTGDVKMATITKHTGPRKLNWWGEGGSSPKGLMDWDICQSVCLAINKSFKTAEHIAQQIDANIGYVQNILDALVREELVVKDSKNRYRVNFIALDGDDWANLVQDIQSNATESVNILAAHLSALEESWNRTTMTERGFGWKDGIWPVLAVFAMPFGIMRHTFSQFDLEKPLRDSGKHYWLGGYEIIPDQPSLWRRGMQPRRDDMWAADTEGSLADDGFLYIQLCAIPVRRQEVPHEQIEDYTRVLSRLAKGISDVGAIAAQAQLQNNRVQEILARLIEMEIVKRRSDDLSLEFPVFNKQDCDLLFPAIDSLALDLASAIYKPAIESVSEKLSEAGYGHLEDQFVLWQRWIVCILAGESIHQSLKGGLLPDPGIAAPPAFGKIGLFEPHELVSF